MINLTNQAIFAPTSSACLEKEAWGIISPKITINPVETSPATNPVAMLLKKTAIAELTATLPSKRVQRRRLPLFLIG